jgi:hypothetical protein
VSFNEEVRKFLLEKGEATGGGDWTYGWRDYNRDRREHKCPWVTTEESKVIEYSYSEFTDTFSDNENKVLLALTHVNCTCGKYTDVTIGVEGGAVELLHSLLDIGREYR